MFLRNTDGDMRRHVPEDSCSGRCRRAAVNVLPHLRLNLRRCTCQSLLITGETFRMSPRLGRAGVMKTPDESGYELLPPTEEPSHGEARVALMHCPCFRLRLTSSGNSDGRWNFHHSTIPPSGYKSCRDRRHVPFLHDAYGYV
jgi:hypothetical protein